MAKKRWQDKDVTVKFADLRESIREIIGKNFWQPNSGSLRAWRFASRTQDAVIFGAAGVAAYDVFKGKKFDARLPFLASIPFATKIVIANEIQRVHESISKEINSRGLLSRKKTDAYPEEVSNFGRLAYTHQFFM